MDIRTILETLREPRRPNLLLELEKVRSHPVVQAFNDTQADIVPTDASDATKDFGRDIENNRSALRDFLGIIKGQGFTPISNGVCGAVFTHPRLTYVIKLFGNDRAYLAFLRYALANQSNPHVPKFRGKLTMIAPNINAVRMERLNRMDHGDADWFGNYMCLLKFSLDKTVTPDEYMEDMGERMERPDFGDNYRAENFIHFMAQQPGLLDVLDKMKRSGIRIDLHDGNIMKRQDDTWVIIDPFFADDSALQTDIADAWMKE